MVHVILRPSPSKCHRFRVVLPSKRAIDFGRVDKPVYLDHHDPFTVRDVLLERGALMKPEVVEETDPEELHRKLLWVEESKLEDWEDFNQEKFWDRWLLWSFPHTNHAKLWMAMRKNVLFMPAEEGFWYG
jgi:hypothetical protein